VDDIEQVGEYIDDEFALLRYVAQVPSSDLPDVGAPRNGNGASAPRATSTPVGKKAPASEATEPQPTPSPAAAPSSQTTT
jgi:hypothetical protein